MKSNNLINEKSPYLQQHAYNPVNWYPWGTVAFDKARAENKPVFLSIGYSSCHWCHVMRKESFEDDEVAQILNQHFICIKVDREERIDIDHIYMTVCQAYTGQGGWPLTIIMTPEQKPFFAGTYFPKNDKMGMPGLISILNKVIYVWDNNRNTLLQSSNEIIDKINQYNTTNSKEFNEEIFQEAFLLLKNNFDNIYGGFGTSPKFPTPHNLFFLLRYWHSTKDAFALKMVEKTLDSMYNGGIYDHIGYGFSRYSTDEKWLVPHFEKMLYDNALLSIAYLEAYQATKNKKYKEIASQIFSYILRDMTSKEGGFYSAEDADSEGVEGKFYVWSMEEIMNVLGEKNGEMFCKYFNITSKGNFEGSNIPNTINTIFPEKTLELINSCRERLFAFREKKVHPHKDDKILTSWNGLMIGAFAIGGRILNNNEYILAAEKAVKFIYKNLTRKDGRLLARYRDGEACFLAYLDDYAFMVWALIELYESTYNADYLHKALILNDDLLKYFWDSKDGGFFVYGSDGEKLITRPKEIYDGAIPSGNSVSAFNLIRLSRLTGQQELEHKSQQILRTFSNQIQSYPSAYTFSLIALLFNKAKTTEIVIVTDKSICEASKMVNILNEEYRPFTLSMVYSAEDVSLKNVAPFVENYNSINGNPTAYVCKNFACQSPVTDIEQFKTIINK